ncbi:MAG: SDR family oxidoreductase [Chloroflexi bacterium]|nr:SDR family oxidoreductase [Chloroflexota bacterium]
MVDDWALILGASSGFGEACAVELAARGMNIFGVHLDRRAALPNVEAIVRRIEGHGRRAAFFNINAADPEKRASALDAMKDILAGAGSSSSIRVLLHSLAFGTLRPFVPEDQADALTKAQLEMTLDVMANSLVYWTQDLVYRGLMGNGGRIFALTSAGSQRVMPHYGAVSAAKACLEAHVRQLAVELAGRGITVNAIRAGVTDTPALRKIPGYEGLLEQALRQNPSGRLTTTADVAAAIAKLSEAETYWVTGNVIDVDSGEFVAS